jgi:hypothetical protein
MDLVGTYSWRFYFLRNLLGVLYRGRGYERWGYFSGVVCSVLFLSPLAVDILSDGYTFYSPFSFDTGRGE